ncbi:helix-turn-helix transcriptional regulator [Halogeometricum borinquense]|uniref:Helix-turn-helix transcriptional regulator n=1 Tax=Halogeometricum borinquense TaxID=60847 RepID=A0A6C0UCG3_9EURY|nr:winged helix-turn-helix domain-containing protein [Halogeometricum borinquense]QIB72994.1 helix-turn-helix transcriptional regulator [Halogeometricum borinquense]QIQ77638.1 helix-turn-helix transcriptional regulator [Halogeometricum borinquense]
MADILPTRPDPPSGDDKEPRVVGLDSDEVSELLSAISSETARTILSALHEEPATPSELADTADTSIQNAQYHLGKLEDAGLIEPGGTAYSEKGREMTVYTPADRALVVVAGQEDDTSGLQTVLTQLLGGVGVVALGSVVIERLTTAGSGPSIHLASESGPGGDDAATSSGGAGSGANGAVNATASTETAAPTASPTETAGDGGFDVSEVTTTAASHTPGDATTTHIQTATETSATGTPTQTPVPEPTTTTDSVRTTAETVVASGDPGGVTTMASLSPGELFLLGGLVTLVVLTVYWWLSR